MSVYVILCNFTCVIFVLLVRSLVRLFVIIYLTIIPQESVMPRPQYVFGTMSP